MREHLVGLGDTAELVVGVVEVERGERRVVDQGKTAVLLGDLGLGGRTLQFEFFVIIHLNI